MTTVTADHAAKGHDRGPGLWARTFAQPDGTEHTLVTNLRVAGTTRDRSGAWLRTAMIALAVLAVTAAIVSYQAQYTMILTYKGVKIISALQAGIPDAAALTMACLGIALALHGKRAIRARALNVAAVAVSVAMNVLAASSGWKAIAIWALAPVAYAVCSDTLIGVVRAYSLARQPELNETLADDEVTPLALVGGFLLWTLRLALAPKSTLGGFRTWVIEEAPVAPGRRAEVQATETVKAIRAVPKPRTPKASSGRRGSGKQARLIALAVDEHGLADRPLTEVSSLATRLAGEVGLHPATARRVLVARARELQAGDSK